MADTKEEKLAPVIKEIRGRWKNYACNLCQSKKWTVAGHVSLAVTEEPGKVVLGGSLIPLAAVSCNVCGNTVFLNEVIIGIVKGGGGQ